MSSLARKVKRNKEKKLKKEMGKDISKKIGLFNKMGDSCLACKKPFDKTDKNQVQSWYVTVRSESDTVRIYCPDCWDNAQKIVEEYTK